jgi:hypothetical protein
VTRALTPDEYWQQLEPRRFSPEEQRVALAPDQEVAGQPVDDAQSGRALGISDEESRSLLERSSIKCFVYREERGRVLGFGGLAVLVMHHHFEVDDRILST